MWAAGSFADVLAVGRDCDDADPSVYRAIVRYPDGDGDGVGATPRTIFCVAETTPAGQLALRVGHRRPRSRRAVGRADAEIVLDLL